MALTSNDETDLLLPLYRGMMELPHFSQFVERLKRRTSAAHASLVTRQTNAAPRDADITYSGVKLKFQPGASTANDALHFQPSAMRPYRIYSLSEMIAADPASTPRYADAMSVLGIADIRMVRIPVEGDLVGILTLARTTHCTAADSALLSNLVPYVEIALKMVHARERERLEALLSAEGLSRLGTGWIAFDAQAHVLAIDPHTASRLAEQSGFEPRAGEHLRGFSASAEKRLAEAAARFSQAPDGNADSLVLATEPRCDAVLIPAPPTLRAGTSAGPFPEVAMIAYCRFDIEGTPERCAQFSRLFGLPAREAELAIALADGKSIAEAAQALGLTLETARNYSKRLYAQLGVRGQTELVRLIHRSSVVLV